jgi:outer membrane protein OmpA-like peptidoglycan-associated protein
MMTVLALIGAASAQTTETIDVVASQAVGFSAQNYRPPVDSRTSMWTERTGTLGITGVTAQLMGGWTRNPLVVRYFDDTQQVLISDLFGADLTAGLHMGRFRLGVLAPVYFTGDGPSVAAGATGLGDLAADLKINLLRDGDAPLGLGVSGRVLAPTASVDGPLGVNAVGWEAMALVDKQLAHWVLAANLGMRGGPDVELSNVSLDDQFFYRGALSYLLDEGADAGFSADVAGQVNLTDVNAAGMPLEAMLGAWTRVAQVITLRAGVGHGFSDGLGDPDARVLVGLSFDPAVDRDRDGDGYVDREDDCPDDPEDFDQRKDEDGCPDMETQLTVVLVTPDGDPVPGVQSTLLVGDSPQVGKSELSVVIEPGNYSFSAAALGYAPVQATLNVPAVPEHRVTQVMKPVPLPVRVRLTDLDGQPIDGEWSMDGQTWTPEKDGLENIELIIGTYTFYGRAKGYVSAEQPLEVKPVGKNEVWMGLGKKTSLAVEQIELKEVVQFKTASAQILSGSYPLLNEVVKILQNHPELTKIKVEGHTDSQGSDAYNLDLSTRRAASIVTYLTSKGIAADRLVSEGFGESKPIATNDTEAGRFQNRRVEIRVMERAAPPPSE